MKLRNILLYLVLMGGLSTSCIKEDHSDCHNVYRLALSYKGDGAEEIFPTKITCVDLYVFDQQNNCVESFRLSESEIQAQMVKLPVLSPGDYKVVCIGNAYETKVEGLNSKDPAQMRFAAEDYVNGETASSNDSLYWSSTDYSIVPFDAKKGEEVLAADFASSHYDVSVEVEGLPVGTKSAEMLVIELVGVSPYTDFNNRAFGEPTTYRLETYAEGHSTTTSFSNIMRHSDHEEVILRVSSAAGEVLAEKTFAQHIAEYNIQIENHEVLIPFKVEIDANVKITAPSWYVVNVKPEF